MGERETEQETKMRNSSHVEVFIYTTARHCKHAVLSPSCSFSDPYEWPREKWVDWNGVISKLALNF